MIVLGTCNDCTQCGQAEECLPPSGSEGFYPSSKGARLNSIEGDSGVIVSVRRTPFSGGLAAELDCGRYDCSGRSVVSVCPGVQYRALFDADVGGIFNGVLVKNVVHKFEIVEVFELYNTNVDVNAFEVAARPVPVLTVAVTEGQRILLTSQTNAAENGIYIVGPVTGGVASLTRSDDMLNGSTADAGLLVNVVNNANTFSPLNITSLHDRTRFVLQTKHGVTVGTDDQSWLLCGSLIPVTAVALSACPNYATDFIVETSPGVFRHDTNGIVGGFSYSYYIDPTNEKLYEGAHYTAPVAVREAWVDVGDVNSALVSSFGDFIYIGWADNSAGDGFTQTYDAAKKFCSIIRSATALSGLTLEDFLTRSTNAATAFIRWAPTLDTESVSDGSLMTAVGNAVVIMAEIGQIPDPCGYEEASQIPPDCGAIITYPDFAQLPATVDFVVERVECGCRHLFGTEANSTPNGTVEFAAGEWKQAVLIPHVAHAGPLYWGCEESLNNNTHDGFETGVFRLQNLVCAAPGAAIFSETAGISVTCTHGDRNPSRIASFETRMVAASYREPAGFMDFRYLCDAELISQDVWTGVDTYRRIDTAGEHPYRPPCVPDPGWVPCDPFDPFNPDCFQPCIEQPVETVSDSNVLEYHQHSYPRVKESSSEGNGNPRPACEDDGFYTVRTTNKEDFEWVRDNPSAEPPDDSFHAGEISLKNTLHSGEAEVDALHALGDYSGDDGSTQFCAYKAGATASDPDTQEVEFDSDDLPLYSDIHPKSAGVAACRLRHGNFSTAFGYASGAVARRYYVSFTTKEIWECGLQTAPETTSPFDNHLGIIGLIDGGVLDGADDETVQFAWASDASGTDFTTTFDPALTHIAVFRGLDVPPTIDDLDHYGFQPYLSLDTTPAETYTVKSTEVVATWFTSGNVYPLTDGVTMTIVTSDFFGNTLATDTVNLASGVPYVIDPPDDWGRVKSYNLEYPSEFACHPNPP